MLEKIVLQTHRDPRGALTAIELKDYISWDPKRIYYVTDVAGTRGGHAVRGEKKLYVCMQGSCIGRFHDGKVWVEFPLQGPSEMVKMEDFCFREFVNFSPGTVLMAISSVHYNKADYVYDFEEFLKESQSGYNHSPDTSHAEIQ